MRENDSFSLFSSVKVVRELLQRRLEDGGGGAQGELEAAMQEIEALWEELRRQSHELAEERQRYSEFFEYAPDAYLVTDSQGVVTAANRAAPELLGLHALELVRKPLISFVDEADRKDFRARLLRASAQPESEVSTWAARLRSRRETSAFTAQIRLRAMPAPDAALAPLCWLIRRE